MNETCDEKYVGYYLWYCKSNTWIINHTILDCVLASPMPLKRPMYQAPGDI
jgi:hypothetical protein